MNISSIEDIDTIYNEFSGVQPGFNLHNIIKVWESLLTFKESDIIKASFIADQLKLNQAITRGIIKFFVNMKLLEDINVTCNPIETKLTYLGTFWLNLIQKDQLKLSIFLFKKFSEFQTTKLIISLIRFKMPIGCSEDEIQNQLGDLMANYWKLYPNYPKNNKTNQPAQKPFNKAILKDILNLFADLCIISQSKDEKYTLLF